MLKISIHSGLLQSQCVANQLAVLDIAYEKKAYLADYLVALSLRGAGELVPAYVKEHPRWSASLWDLVARALAQVLYRSKQIPPSAKVDRRCAYATRICATIERLTASDRGIELGTVEILQRGKQRGLYTATFDEDILGKRTADFEFGCKALNPAELLLRAICQTYFKSDLLGPAPALIVPPFMDIEGTPRFHIAALDEPAFTGFRRYREERKTTDAPGMESLPRKEDYQRFLLES
jgi:hypothetical protein